MDTGRAAGEPATQSSSLIGNITRLQLQNQLNILTGGKLRNVNVLIEMEDYQKEGRNFNGNSPGNAVLELGCFAC